MKKLAKIAVLLLTGFLLFAAAGCGEEPNTLPEEEIAGKDWRTWGIIHDFGTITRDGEDTDVCVCVHETDAAFYYDEEEQVYYDGVEYPMLLPDAESAYQEIDFSDLNGDGQSDVCMTFHYDEDNSTVVMVWFWYEDDGFVFQEDFSQVSIVAEDDVHDYVGLWEYVGENIWLHVYADATWAFVNSEDDVIESGVVLADATGIELHFDGNGDTLRLERSDDGSLLDPVNGGVLVPVEKIASNIPYFEKHGLPLNYTMDDGSHLLKNGVVSYLEGGSNIMWGDVYWEVNKVGEQKHDGIREIEFDIVCYIPASSLPQNNAGYYSAVGLCMYDFYTGKKLNSSTAYDNTGHEENHYVDTVAWNGETYEIEYFYSTEWGSSGDWAMVYKQNCVVYCPEDYDGLIVAAEAEPKSYEMVQQRIQNPTREEVLTSKVDDPYTSLYFKID